ncbi:MAG: glycosyl hydrolase 108 family protein [Deltaproteobacteria bacterium]|nr:glycosyl hydrolase 108 family protein [Deltaproteobacteria bacterium]
MTLFSGNTGVPESPLARALDIVIRVIEKECADHPRDPGGKTCYGVTFRDHPDLWENGEPTLAQARERLTQAYWLPARCDMLPWPLALYVFDGAVNQGVEPAVKMLQQAARMPQDGVLSNNALVSISRAEQQELGAVFMTRRVLRYTGTRNFDVFGPGWLKRLFIIASEAQA